MQTLFNLFLIVSAIHGFAFSLILGFSKNGRYKSMIFLNLMILSISLNNIQSWALANNLLQHKFALDYIQIPWHFLSAPFFYLFLINYLRIEDRFLKGLRIIIPVFTIMCLAQILFVLYFNDNKSLEELDLLYEKYTSFEEVFSFLVSIFCFSYSYHIFRNKKKLFTKVLSFDNLNWINTFFKVLIVVYIFWVAALIVKFNSNFDNFLYAYYPLRIATTVIIYILGYQVINQIRIAKERKVIRKNIQGVLTESIATPIEMPVNTIETVTYNGHQKEDVNVIEYHTELNQKHKEEFIKIDDYIREHQKYLLPKYTLNSLSNDLEISSSKLSIIINNHADKSFIDYINEMRVEQAKKLLTNPKYSNYTIVSLGLECGFNSKSSFYEVFKKYSGCTPAAYKKMNFQQ